MCDSFCNCDDDEEYVPNEYTVSIPADVWFRFNHDAMSPVERLGTMLRSIYGAEKFDAILGNDADAEMEAVRARDCHRDVLDAMGIGA